MMNKLRKKLNNKKGFTLVEVIVVIVIIAIMAAVMLPSLTGYIDEANSTAAISEARTAYAALQTTVSMEKIEGKTYVNGTAITADGAKRMNKLVFGAEDMGETKNQYKTTSVTGIKFVGTTISEFKYTTFAGDYTVAYANGTFTASPVVPNNG